MEVVDADFGRLLITTVVKSPTYASKVTPYLRAEYFMDTTEAAVADTIINFYNEYGKAPNTHEVVAEVKSRKDLNHLDRNVIGDIFSMDSYNVTDIDWMIKRTEKFIRRARVSAAFAATFDKFEKDDYCDDIPSVFQEAMSFSFDQSLGRSYVNDRHERWGMYTAEDARISFLISMMDRITNGGVTRGTLNCFLAGTGVGKSMFMCDLACKAAKAGRKVLYITMEMAEIKIEERVDANLMDIDINKLRHMSEKDYEEKLDVAIREMIVRGGDIITKQYPTSAAHAGHFHTLLTEFKNRGLEFDEVFIDYLNICDCKRNVPASDSYTRIKCIAEELRALAIVWDLPVITATQTNRGGQNSTDLDFEDVSESHGLSATLDLFLGLISSEEMEQNGRIMVRQIKNRYGDKNYFKRFPVGVERCKMRFYDLKEDEITSASPTEAAKADPNAKSAIEVMQEKAGSIDNMFDMSVLGKTKP